MYRRWINSNRIGYPQARIKKYCRKSNGLGLMHPYPLTITILLAPTTAASPYSEVRRGSQSVTHPSPLHDDTAPR